MCTHVYVTYTHMGEKRVEIVILLLVLCLPWHLQKYSFLLSGLGNLGVSTKKVTYFASDDGIWSESKLQFLSALVLVLPIPWDFFPYPSLFRCCHETNLFKEFKWESSIWMNLRSFFCNAPDRFMWGPFSTAECVKWNPIKPLTFKIILQF